MGYLFGYSNLATNTPTSREHEVLEIPWPRRASAWQRAMLPAALDRGYFPDTTVSQQLALLRAQGLVTTRREGTTIYYRLASEPVKDIMAMLYKHFCAGSDLPVAKHLESLDAE